jgi:outer membrane protein assembly factor BamB
MYDTPRYLKSSGISVCQAQTRLESGRQAAGGRIVALISLLLLLLPGMLSAEDWPCWGYDNSRQGASPAVKNLPEKLTLHWRRELPPPQRAWLRQRDDHDKLEFDLSYSPVVAGQRLFVASMTNDSLTAYDTASGEQLWQFFADGPMRLAPYVWQNKVYAVSDDGSLYCVAADSGRLLWRFNGAPGPHLVLGNRRLISLWPARGGAMVVDGSVYFASGVWPFLGTCVFALQAESGEVVWANTGHSTQWQAQPHAPASSFSGIAPQGYIALGAERLVIAGGRSLPAMFDRHSGELIYHSARARPEGGYRVMTDDKHYYNHGTAYLLANGARMGKKEPENELRAALLAKVAELTSQLDGPVFEQLVADNRLFVSTETGTLYCFGAERESPPNEYSWKPAPLPEPDHPDAELARRLLEKFAVSAGWALIPGGASDAFLDYLLLHSELDLVVLEPEPQQRLRQRQRYSAAGLYGERLTCLSGQISEMRYPEYVSSLLLVPNPERAGIKAESGDLQQLYKLIRPYCGRAWINFPPAENAAKQKSGFFSRLFRRHKTDSAETTPSSSLVFNPPDGRFERDGSAIILARTSGLPGAGEWTHQHANAAQSVISQDQLVRPPFAPIWFGTTTNVNVIPRHHHGPRPQVAGGVLATLGVETISARCVYTGRELWIKEFPGIGHAFTSLELEEKWRAGQDVYMVNDPGATYIGSPFVTLPDSIYLRYQGEIYRLRPEDGKLLGRWPLPSNQQDEKSEFPDWGHISVQGDCLITTSEPYIFMEGKLGKISNGWDGSASRRLIVMDRFSGAIHWQREAQIGFRHNAICSSGNKLFVNDLLSASALDLALRRGMPIKERPRLYALDLASGRELWAMESEVFGTFLSYSSEHDVLLEGGTRDGRSHLKDEPSDRLLARRGKDGEILWQRREYYSGPLIIHDEMIISGRPGAAVDLLTGKNYIRIHPLTDEELPWRYWKSYGCGSSNASPHLLLFRSGAAGFTDLENDSGTGNIGGFKSGCTASMIPADGILNAPDYTRTCICSYQNQTSLGLIHRPEMELWYSNQPLQGRPGKIRRLGVNLGAPGDRRAKNGTLWLHAPRLAPSAEVPILIECGNEADGLRIVGAGGTEAENTLDLDNSTAWVISDSGKGTFNPKNALVFSTSETISIDHFQMAWRGPIETAFSLQAKVAGKWQDVYSGVDNGLGRKFSRYDFPSTSSDQWRLSFAAHQDTSEDARKRRKVQSVQVWELRLGDLPESAHAYFIAKPAWHIHTLLTKGAEDFRWITSSGVKDIRRLLIPAAFVPETNYELTLFFAEPEASAPGERVFDVYLQGEKCGSGIDPFALAGERNSGRALTLPAVQLNGSLQLDFHPQPGSRYSALLCGLELRQVEP